MTIDKSRRNRAILFFIFLLVAGGIVGGVVYWRESEKHKAQKELESASPATVLVDSVEVSATSLEANSTTPLEGSSTTSSGSPKSSSCGNVKVRKEWRDLSDKEQADFLNAVNEMYKKPSTKGNENLQMDFVKIHIDNRKAIHHTNAFLLWHRHFLVEYEKELQAINPSVSLPYWDFGMDYSNPSKSPLFEVDAFGGDGDNEKGCIKTGKLVGIKTQFHETSNSPHCVKRKFGGNGNKVRTLTDPSVMLAYSLLKSFEKFSTSFEKSPHSLAHNFIGGDMISNQSPSDPLFFLLHANVDRYFLIWQKNNPDGKYPGNLQDKLAAYDIPLSTPFQDTEKSDYCYSYSVISSKSMRKRDISSPNKPKSKILYPSRVPSEFTTMMGGDPKIVEKLEDKEDKFIDCLNSEGFKSPANSYSADRNWKNHNIKQGLSRFGKNSNSRKQLESCLKYLEEP